MLADIFLGVAARSAVAALQSVGTSGLSTAGRGLLATVGGGVGAGVGAAIGDVPAILTNNNGGHPQ